MAALKSNVRSSALTNETQKALLDDFILEDYIDLMIPFGEQLPANIEGFNEDYKLNMIKTLKVPKITQTYAKQIHDFIGKTEIPSKLSRTNIEELHFTLINIKNDLKIGTKRFKDEFVSKHELNLIVKLLNWIQTEIANFKKDSPTQISKLKDGLIMEFNCFICIKQMITYMLESRKTCLAEDYLFEVWDNINFQNHEQIWSTEIVKIQFLSIYCQNSRGNKKQWFFDENVRSLLAQFYRNYPVQRLTDFEEFALKSLILKFCNELCNDCISLRQRIYFQHSIETCGFNISQYDELNLIDADTNTHCLVKEINTWNENFIEVDNFKVLKSENINNKINEKVCNRGYATQNTNQDDHSKSRLNDQHISLPPEPPPLPPVIPRVAISRTVRKKVKSSYVDLPLVNISPLHNIQNTIFEDVNQDQIMRTMDFSELEDTFRLHIRTDDPSLTQKRQKIFENMTKRICFIEPNKAKNMIITKRRTGLSSRQIRDAIDQLEIDTLPGEYANLLVRYIPDKETMKNLMMYHANYSKLGEAEQFSFQLTQVEGLERKLNCMAFIGLFEDIKNFMEPQITNIYENSQKIISCKKLKRLFEIILVITNYMNASKRGYVSGFRLSSLNKLKEVNSKTKKGFSLIHHIAQLIHDKRTNINPIWDELDLTIYRGASFENVCKDMIGLERGMELVKSQMNRNPSVKSLENFYNKSNSIVKQLSKRFEKMSKVYKKVCSMLGETHQNIEADELFTHIANFMNELKKAHNDLYGKALDLHQDKLITDKQENNSQTNKMVSEKVSHSLKTHQTQKSAGLDNVDSGATTMKVDRSFKHSPKIKPNGESINDSEIYTAIGSLDKILNDTPHVQPEHKTLPKSRLDTGITIRL